MNDIKRIVLAVRKKGQLLLIEHLIGEYDRQSEEYAEASRAFSSALEQMNDANRALRAAHKASKKTLAPITARAIHARVEAKRALDRQAREGKRLEVCRDSIYAAVRKYEEKFGESLIPRADKEYKEHA